MKPANGIAGRVGIARGVMECGCVPRGAGSAAARRAPSRVEYFRHGHSCEAAAAGLRHSRGPGAFVRACESAVAAERAGAVQDASGIAGSAVECGDLGDSRRRLPERGGAFIFGA